MKLIFLLMILRCSSSLDKQWVDPHDMNTNAKEKLENLKLKDPSGEGSNPHQCNCSEKTKARLNDELSFIYLKRVISLLVNSASPDVKDVRIRNGKFVLDVQDDNYKFLLEFTKNIEVDAQKLRQLDMILTNLFQRTIGDDIYDSVLFAQQKFLSVLFEVKHLILICVCLALYITYHLSITQFSIWYIIKYFLVIIIIIDYAYRYQILLEEAEEQNFQVISEKCKEIKWYTYLFFNKEDCKKKVVTPLEVLLRQVEHIIIIPLSSLGTGMGKFAAELWGGIPWPWHFFIFPVMLLFVLLAVAVIMTIFNKSTFKFNLMHLFHFEFRGHQDHGNLLPSLDRLLLNAVNHRQMVQDMRISDNPSHASESNVETSDTHNPSEIQDIKITDNPSQASESNVEISDTHDPSEIEPSSEDIPSDIKTLTKIE